MGDGMLGVGNLGADQIETNQMMGTKWRAVGDTVYPFTLPASGEGERIRRRRGWLQVHTEAPIGERRPIIVDRINSNSAKEKGDRGPP